VSEERRTKDWEAWIDLMPGKEPTLYVIGYVEVPTSGYTAELSAHTPPGTNPRDLILDLKVREPPPGEPVLDIVQWIPAGYAQPAEKGQFDTVTVIGGAAGIPVKETSLASQGA
jgi:hypothetical protein